MTGDFYNAYMSALIHALIMVSSTLLCLNNMLSKGVCALACLNCMRCHR